jgi:hypothetical protein
MGQQAGIAALHRLDQYRRELTAMGPQPVERLFGAVIENHDIPGNGRGNAWRYRMRGARIQRTDASHGRKVGPAVIGACE